MGRVLKQLAVAAIVIGISMLPLPMPVKRALLAAGVSMALGTASQALFGPKMPKAQASRLNASFDPQAHRKFVFGETAMNTDIRYYEPSGTDQEYFDYIVATAAHEVESIDQIYFDDELAWTSAGVQGRYVGYLTAVNIRLVGTADNTIAINGGNPWGSSCRLTGCSYVHFRIKRTGSDNKASSPLVNGLPTRLTIKGKGAKLYDPRRDSEVAGGSGAERANDQTTWGSGASSNRDNPALQLLWFLLGYKINGKLSVGCGVPPARIDLPSFITAANICDEAITLANDDTQPRYRTAGVGSDADNRMDIIQLFLTCMNGTLRDSNGRLSLQVMKNDLATPVLSFDDNDILDDFTWNQTSGLDKAINAVHGKYTDPSGNSLYQPIEYPTISITSVDGIERLQTLDLPWVEDGRRAQRIAKQVLQRAQYRGTFSATFSMKALGCEVGDIVNISFEPLGWTNKPFRVMSQTIDQTGQVPMALIEENAAIYAWDKDERPVVTATAPTVYNPLNSPFILAISDAEAAADGKIVSFYQSSAPTAQGVGDIWIDTDDKVMYRWNGVSWVEAKPTEITTAINAASNAQATADGKINTYFQSSAPTPEADGDLWFETDANNALWRWNQSANQWVLATDTRVTAAIGSSGIINTDKVVTDSITAGAVSSLVTSYSQSSVATATNDTYLAIQSAQITSAGGSPIAVDGCFNLKVQIGSGVTQPRRIGVTMLMQWQDNLGNTGVILNNVLVDFVIYNSTNQVWQMIPFGAVHSSPVSGRTYTYTMYAKYNDGGSGDVIAMQSFVHRFMRIQELKR